MTYRSSGQTNATFESPPGGLGLVLLIGLFVVPMWAIPIGLVYDTLDGGFQPIFAVFLVADAIAWIVLLRWASRGERLHFDTEGLRWERYRALGPIRTGPTVVRQASWPLIQATLVRSLRTTKSGKPFERRTLKLTMPDGTHEVLGEAVKPWPDLVRELEARLGERWQAIDDHGALGAAVQRMVDQRLGQSTAEPSGKPREDGDVRLE